MEIDPYVVAYFNDRYPAHSSGEIHDVTNILKPLFAEHGATAVRKALKEAGVLRVPQFIKDYKGNYIPRILASEILIDGVTHVIYLRLADKLHQFDADYVQVGYKEYYTVASINFYIDDTVDNSFSIIDWIRHGEECPECSTPFINISQRHAECPQCRQGNEPLSYSTRAEDVLGEVASKEVRFGIELEYEGVTAKDVKKTLFKHAIAKRDGSIDSGVEVVTLPAPMKLHKEKLKKFFQDVITESHSNTGMHVHIERSKLSEYQIGFILEFLNKESLYPKLEKIAGRNFKENHYCKQKPEMTMTWGLSYSNKLERADTDKYSTLNTSKDKTIEVRIFSSPESHLECSAKLEFIEGLVAFSSPYAVNVKSLKDKFQWDTFDTFMTANKKHYPSFYAYYQGVI